MSNSNVQQTSKDRSYKYIKYTKRPIFHCYKKYVSPALFTLFRFLPRIFLLSLLFLQFVDSLQQIAIQLHDSIEFFFLLIKNRHALRQSRIPLVQQSPHCTSPPPRHSPHSSAFPAVSSFSFAALAKISSFFPISSAHNSRDKPSGTSPSFSTPSIPAVTRSYLVFPRFSYKFPAESRIQRIPRIFILPAVLLPAVLLPAVLLPFAQTARVCMSERMSDRRLHAMQLFERFWRGFGALDNRE